MSTQNVTAAQSSYSFIKEVAEDKNMQETKGWVPIVINILSYLDDATLKSLIFVCKNFCKIMKSDTIWALQLKRLETQRKENFRKKLNQEDKLNEEETKLTKRKQDMGRLEFLASRVSFFDKIINLSSFPSIGKLKTAYKEYADLKESCDHLKKQHEIVQSLDVELLMTLDRKYGVINTKKMTVELLGERYANLPILDLKSIGGFHIVCIGPDSMTAPIMKGRDADERSFIAIRAKNKETGKLYVQTFYNSAFPKGTWSTSCSDSPIIPFSDHGTLLKDTVMSNGKVNEAGYKALKDLIEKGENEKYVLV